MDEKYKYVKIEARLKLILNKINSLNSSINSLNSKISTSASIDGKPYQKAKIDSISKTVTGSYNNLQKTIIPAIHLKTMR